ncbi:hypothetical protein GLAREA_06682 [Glarea lozoyensis ATCC 20868]|uniref:2EXR domain-containing protein n=1 Tax=Glarea lozoyensis (strain ATCC 20868 / MF5171) TaxID=1116229 RepID=S3D966_GLAL2|nr:uncharacterized protein GLAREA_06682 [Glarea lozoyensis ATCC 20868]EPE33669.1 hypothetical protein GLAREA_06682 [Glarea lozoyensis ATCC 20868]
MFEEGVFHSGFESSTLPSGENPSEMSHDDIISSGASDSFAEIKRPSPENAECTSEISSLLAAEDATTSNSESSVSNIDDARNAVAVHGEFEPQPLKEFRLLSNLVIELQRMIYRTAARMPRFIHWGASNISPLFHLNREARAIALKENFLVERPYLNNTITGFYFHPARDIVYRDRFIHQPVALAQLYPEELQLWFLLPKPAEDPLSVYWEPSGEVRLRIDSQHDMTRYSHFLSNSQTGVVYSHVLHNKVAIHAANITRISFSIDVASRTGRAHISTLMESMLLRCRKFFPGLEEVICILWPHLDCGDDGHDFRVVKYPNGEGWATEFEKSHAITVHDSWMRLIYTEVAGDAAKKAIERLPGNFSEKNSSLDARKFGHANMFKLTFMRKKDQDKPTDDQFDNTY